MANSGISEFMNLQIDCLNIEIIEHFLLVRLLKLSQKGPIPIKKCNQLWTLLPTLIWWSYALSKSTAFFHGQAKVGIYETAYFMLLEECHLPLKLGKGQEISEANFSIP